jgi:hypothetical protein
MIIHSGPACPQQLYWRDQLPLSNISDQATCLHVKSITLI